jgi:ABC-2 type transport system ATP-binding protein
MTVPCIEAVGLKRSFGDRPAVDGLNLRVEAGEIFGLVGPDGAGKTTTLRMVTGLVTPVAGSVRLLGLDPFEEGEAARELLGYMPQRYSLYGDLTVEENLAFFAEMFCLDKEAFLKRRERLLGLTRLDAFGSRRADALSGGMYKKLALACALLHRPKVLVLDEPTNGVDPLSRRELWDLLHEFIAEGVAVVLATPYMDEAARCHRVGLLYEGRLLEEGSPQALLAAFPHAALEVRGDRRRIGEAVERDEGVLAFTPAGALLRVVVRRGEVLRLEAALAGAGASVRETTPTFEDLFLSRVRERRLADQEVRA